MSGLTASAFGDMLAINHVSRRVCSLVAHAWAGAQLEALRRLTEHNKVLGGLA